LETSPRDRGNSKAKTKDIDCDVDQLNKDVRSAPRTQKSMAVQNIRISKVLGRKKRDLFPKPHCTGKQVNNNEGKEEAARGSSIYLGDIHGNTESKRMQYYRGEMGNRSG